MTSQSDRIQSLVEQISSILSDASPSDSGKTGEYQILEQARQQLAQLQKSQTTDQSPSQAVTDVSQFPLGNDWQAPAPALAESAQQVLQSIVQEMAYLRMNTMQPLREEITRLQQERSYLATEVQQLQQQRQQFILAQQTDQQQMINGFLHALMGRLQEQLTQQVAQTMMSLSGTSAIPLASSDSEQVVQLDSTLKVLFESLQTSVDTYQDSLEDSLRKMHGLGQQGEAMFTAFVNRLAGQLGQEASLHLRPATSPNLELPTEDVIPAFEQRATNEENQFSSEPPFSSGPDDKIAPAYLDQLLEDTVEEVDTFVGLQPSLLADVNEDVNEDVNSGASSSIQSPTQSPITSAQPYGDIGSVVKAEQQPDPAATQMLDQIIDQLENNTIDAVEALDTLDLGFGLDNLELADVPIEAASASVSNRDSFSSTSDGDDGDDEDIKAIRQLESELADQFSQDPINLSSGLELDTPLDPVLNIRLDKDDTDVERFIDAISPSQEEQRQSTFSSELLGIDDPEQAIANHPLLSDSPNPDFSMLAEQTNDGIFGDDLTLSDVSAANSWSGVSVNIEGGIADVSQADLQTDDMVRDSDDGSDFLLQQLSSELLDDDVLGEEFLAEPLDESIEESGDRISSTSPIATSTAASTTLETINSDDAGISFLINAPVDSSSASSVDNYPNNSPQVTDNQPDQDFYAPFTAATIPDSSAPGSLDGDEDIVASFSRIDDLGNDEEIEDVLAQSQLSTLEATTTNPAIVNTIQSLSDLIDSTGIASRPPVSLPDSASNNEENADSGLGDEEIINEDAYRSPSFDLLADIDSTLEIDNSINANPIDEDAQREADLLARLDLRLDARTISELANDLSNDQTLEPYSGELESLGSDIADSAPLPPPLSADFGIFTEEQVADAQVIDNSGLSSNAAASGGMGLTPTNLDNPEENAIGALQDLFSNGSIVSNESNTVEGDSLFGTLESGEKESSELNDIRDDLTPVSWTLAELISNDPPNPNAPSSNAPSSDDSSSDLLSASASGPLSGIEEAKTLADLLRGQNSAASAPPGSSAPEDSLSSLPEGWFEENDELDSLPDSEKKNNY
ncbi:MAG: hypothetical protein AAGD25_05745 [Cyanobacteria bacterium P01_F01_bin.150]